MMNRQTGGQIDQGDHIAQSVIDILTTPVGSRIARRSYGSQLPDLIDQPLTPATELRIYAATALALAKWEPRISLQRITLTQGTSPASRVLRIEAKRLDRPTTPQASFTVPLRKG